MRSGVITCPPSISTSCLTSSASTTSSATSPRVSTPAWRPARRPTGTTRGRPRPTPTEGTRVASATLVPPPSGRNRSSSGVESRPDARVHRPPHPPVDPHPDPDLRAVLLRDAADSLSPPRRLRLLPADERGGQAGAHPPVGPRPAGPHRVLHVAPVDGDRHLG